MSRNLSRRRLEELSQTLSERDRAILRSLEKCRYLQTGQVRRLHYTDSKTESAGQRAANWGTAKLRSYGLIDVLERRVGGVRAGSGAYVWVLTESGANLLHLNDPDYTKRSRVFEPSRNFMKHTLEVAETYIQLTEICRRGNLTLTAAEMEPNCWRAYTGADGRPASMKPDMFAIIASEEYEDVCFIEVDMNTESPSVVLDKCRRYTHYRRSGLEQKQHTVFPMVVWIVGSENRNAKLRQYIADCREIIEADKLIFTVILKSEFETLITGGAEALAQKGAIV